MQVLTNPVTQKPKILGDAVHKLLPTAPNRTTRETVSLDAFFTQGGVRVSLFSPTICGKSGDEYTRSAKSIAKHLVEHGFDARVSVDPRLGLVEIHDLDSDSLEGSISRVLDTFKDP